MTRANVYVDCGSGVAGDMLLAAQLDLGLSLQELNRVLHRAIPFERWTLVSKPTERQGWPARSLHVDGDRHFGTSARMKRVVQCARLPPIAKQNALLMLERLIAAEKMAHGHGSDGVFDAEGLGLLDTLVDVLGSAWGFWRLGLQNVSASSINTGRIAPATGQMLKSFKIPAYSTQSQYELATPTGVAILSVLAANFSSMTSGRLVGAGYGAGSNDIPGKPNVLAIYRMEPAGGSAIGQDSVVLLETVMDDMDPRLYPHVSDVLMRSGALDAWWVSAGMKKGRPGIAYSVLCRPEDESHLVRLLFEETTTLGIRRNPLARWVLPRRTGGYHKAAQLPDGGTRYRVEFERARLKSKSLSIPLKKLLK